MLASSLKDVGEVVLKENEPMVVDLVFEEAAPWIVGNGEADGI